MNSLQSGKRKAESGKQLPVVFAPEMCADIFIVRVHTESRLAWAVARFNAALHPPKLLRLPAWPETIEEAAELADLRGRSDIGADLRDGMEEEL